MKTWLTVAVCLLAVFLTSEKSSVSGLDQENEEVMNLRGFDDDEEEYADYDDYEDDDTSGDGEDRKRRSYGNSNSGNLGQPTNLRPVLVSPNGPHNGGVSHTGVVQPQPLPGVARPLPGNGNPVFPQPLPGGVNPGFPQPLPGNRNPGFHQPLPGGVNPGFPQPSPGNRNPGYNQPLQPLPLPSIVRPGVPQPLPGVARPPVHGKICRGVARGSPHWVPGLDTWCPQNCPTGNCPSYLCTCY